jgi:hypothetical protein
MHFASVGLVTAWAGRPHGTDWRAALAAPGAAREPAWIRPFPLPPARHVPAWAALLPPPHAGAAPAAPAALSSRVFVQVHYAFQSRPPASASPPRPSGHRPRRPRALASTTCRVGASHGARCATIRQTCAGRRAAACGAPLPAGPVLAIVLGARRATIRQPSRSARNNPPDRHRPSRCVREALPSEGRTLGARRRGNHPTGELRRAAHHHSPAVTLGAQHNTIRRLLARRADGLLLSKSWTDGFECLESTFERSNVEQKYTDGI